MNRPRRVIVPVLFLVSLARIAWADEPPPASPPVTTGPDSQRHDDGRRTTGRFLANLGRGVVGVVSRESLVPLVVGGAATATGVPFDGNVRGYFAERRRFKALGDSADSLGQPIVLTPLAGALFGFGRLAHDGRFRDATYDIGEVFLVTAVWTTAIKYPTHRRRPNNANYLSFPSGHTSNAFAWATVAAHHYGWKLGVPSYLVAGAIGVGRMEKDAHWLTDVLAGATLGILVGRTVVRRDGEPDKPPATSLSIQPSRALDGTGTGLAVTVSF
jgi:membrane-associated phospholipid phosphatase